MTKKPDQKLAAHLSNRQNLERLYSVRDIEIKSLRKLIEHYVPTF